VGVGTYDGAEMAWSYHAEHSGTVTWHLLNPTPMELDHDLFVLSGTGGVCRSTEAVARGFNDVTFDAVAGEDYFLLIDGFDGDEGWFEAQLSCEGDDSPPPDCPLTDPDDPTGLPGDPYRCRDSQLNGGAGCGEEGYPRDFGARYAEIYMGDIYPDVSQAGQDFLDANLLCLQQAFLDDTDPAMSCEEVAEAGFDAHPGCYLESGICDVPLADKLLILNAVEWADLFHWSQLEAFAAIATSCPLL